MTLSLAQALRDNRILAFLGRRSMPLYVVHIFFITTVRIVMVRVLGITELAILIPACLVAAYAGPLALSLVAERLGITMLADFGRIQRAPAKASVDRAAPPHPENGVGANDLRLSSRVEN